MEGHVIVVGAGAMGAGIAQVCAQAGYRVKLVDVKRQAVDKALDGMRRSVEKLHSKGRVSDPADAVLARVEGIASADTTIEPVPDALVAIEAVYEDTELKRNVLARIEKALPSQAIMATNTSGIPIAELAGALKKPDRFLGLHFFNPAALMRVVEVVKGPDTANEAFTRVVDFVRAIGRDPIMVRKDIPGFVLNRIAMAASNEAIRLVEMGVATAEEVDRGVKGAFGWKMGPLETADMVGLDVLLAARTQIYERTGDNRFKPPAIIGTLVKQGRLGRKTKGGFYDYD
jgi:3-hydroxybutyryl-CoA dehydrogenase